MSETRIYTSESVSPGHPDKVADQVSDAILDKCLENDPNARAAIETLVTRGLAVVVGELTCKGYVDIAKIVRQTIIDAGYDRAELGFDGHTCGVMVSIQEQSPDIAVGVDTGGAGDQGIMYGYATRETPELMPLPISVAHSLTKQSAKLVSENPELGFGPDAKSQVSVIYENGIPKKIDTIVLSTQHKADLTHEEVQQRVQKHIIDPVLSQYQQYRDSKITTHINPTGIFVVGGPLADAGVTGRKIIVDTYGGLCPHGGGAFSGKDPTKVDRSAAYMARYLAKLIVAAGLAERAQVAIAYAIGIAQPVALNIDTFGTNIIPNGEIESRIRKQFDLSPAGIIKLLNLKKAKYLPTAKNGHFGNAAFNWEDTALASTLTKDGELASHR
jgi:S-adenosylmethionine synthetase